MLVWCFPRVKLLTGLKKVVQIDRLEFFSYQIRFKHIQIHSNRRVEPLGQKRFFVDLSIIVTSYLSQSVLSANVYIVNFVRHEFIIKVLKNIKIKKNPRHNTTSLYIFWYSFIRNLNKVDSQLYMQAIRAIY